MKRWKILNFTFVIFTHHGAFLKMTFNMQSDFSIKFLYFNLLEHFLYSEFSLSPPSPLFFYIVSTLIFIMICER